MRHIEFPAPAVMVSVYPLPNEIGGTTATYVCVLLATGDVQLFGLPLEDRATQPFSALPNSCHRVPTSRACGNQWCRELEDDTVTAGCVPADCWCPDDGCDSVETIGEDGINYLTETWMCQLDLVAAHPEPSTGAVAEAAFIATAMCVVLAEPAGELWCWGPNDRCVAVSRCCPLA